MSADLSAWRGLRVLVCGGSGYLGSRLVLDLRRRGASCAVLDLHEADDRPSDVPFVAADIRSSAGLEAAMDRIDVVVNAVAQVPLARDRRLFQAVNVDGTRNLLEAARAKGVRKFLQISSSAVYGAPDANPVTEETPPRPAEAYGRAKLESEALCRAYAERGLDATILRPRTILGHGRLGIFQILFDWVREGANIPVLGDGSNRYQFVHADDLADACARAAVRPGPRLYNCGAARFGTMRELLERLCAHAGTGSKVRSVPRQAAEWAIRAAGALGLSPLGPYHALMYGRSLYFDLERAGKELGWSPARSNDEMIAESYDWYLANRARVPAWGHGSAHRSGVRQGLLRILGRIL